jgi:hypothetical protein
MSSGMLPIGDVTQRSPALAGLSSEEASNVTTAHAASGRVSAAVAFAM